MESRGGGRRGEEGRLRDRGLVRRHVNREPVLGCPGWYGSFPASSSSSLSSLLLFRPPPAPSPLSPAHPPPPFLSPCPPTPLILLLPSSRQGCFSVMFSVRLTSDKDPGNGRQLSRPTRASPIRFSWRFGGLAQTGSEHCSGELSRTWGGFGDIAADKIVKSH